MDYFSDDGFDDLNDNALQELENNAIQFTQANNFGQTQIAPSTQTYGLRDDDLDDTVVIDELAQKPARPAAPPERPLPPQHARPLPPTFSGQPRWSQQGPHQQPNAPYQARPSYPSQSRAIPPARLPPPQSQRFPVRPGPPGRPPHPGLRPHGLQASQAPPGSTAVDSGDDVVETLQARLAVLQSELNSARGEASILRSKYDKEIAAHDAEVARLKKQNSEQLAQKERIVEAAVAAERNAATELEFTRQDLKEELGRAKTKKKDGTVTPKKTKKWAAGDGFDDIEILPSPSKGHGQRRRDPGPVATSVTERTPSKGKRKRPVVDSPINALETHSEDISMLDSQHDKLPSHAEAKPLRVSAFDDFYKLVMAHGSLHGQPLTFDLFARYALPSDPGQSFASLLIQELACMSSSKKSLDLLVDFCNLIIDLWARSLAEKYYSPTYDLAALIFFTLQLNTTGVAPRILSALLPVAQDTCLLVAQPRFHGQAEEFSADIDLTQSLSVICLCALGCLGPTREDDIGTGAGDASERTVTMDIRAEFWKSISLDFLKVMLSTKQQEADYLSVLSLLCTSVFPDSIGPIPPPPPSADQAEAGNVVFYTTDTIGKAIANQVALHLTDPLTWAAPGSSKLCEGRLAVLRTLQAFATSPFGALLLASSPIAIPRLVTLLSWAIDRLYDMDVSTDGWDIRPLLERGKQHTRAEQVDQGALADTDDPDGTQKMELDDEEKTAGQATVAAPVSPPVPRQVFNPNIEMDPTPLLFRIISQTTLVLHTLITDPQTGNVANIAAKLSASHGGSQRYQLMLARLNFAEEDLVLESGVDAETMELAHELLELFVTPEDGEAVGEVFGV